MRAIAAMVTVVALAAMPAFAGPDGSLDLYNVPVLGFNVFGEPNIGECQGSVTSIFAGAIGQYAIAVFGVLQGASVAGVSGAEFYVTGLERTDTSPPGEDQIPTNWNVAFTAATGLAVLTSPVQPHLQGMAVNRRANVFWDVEGPDDPDCQKATLTFYGRIEATSGSGTTHPNDHFLEVVTPMPPSNPSYVSPVLISCVAPQFPPFAVTGGPFLVNPVNNICGDAVTVDTWGGVKSLYR